MQIRASSIWTISELELHLHDWMRNKGYCDAPHTVQDLLDVDAWISQRKARLAVRYLGHSPGSLPFYLLMDDTL